MTTVAITTTKLRMVPFLPKDVRGLPLGAEMRTVCRPVRQSRYRATAPRLSELSIVED
jgi:hypothetical protein